MTEHRYRAYISYSHKDETWAAWLHHALESYRVPRNLVGNKTGVGEVPKRIRPVFRDRDDLSSATDLEQTVKQALADSDNLIVVCSPDAAASRWVGEEIRQFASLGRADRIFCIIVDGEPEADGSVSACFPAALAEIGFQEPLAADVRKWADGKNVAKLKLIAGLLSIRLDELRQRDLQRRRKRHAVFGLGFLAVATLAVMTVFSQISEQHEREKAEQLATFIVDLGERLQSDADLETLALISSEALKHLQGLDPDNLSAETGEKVALVLRQMGLVSQYQGRPDDALEAFQQSRDLFARLHNKYAETPGLLFGLGNAEFYIGNLHFEQARYEDAMASMQIYHNLNQELLRTDPDNPYWMLEMSYSHNNLAAVQMSSGQGIGDITLAHVAEAIRLMEEVVALKPGDEEIASNYATTLAWAADAQEQACNLEVVSTLRDRTLELAEYSTQKDPGNNGLTTHYAYAITGVVHTQILTGDLELAEQNLTHAISLLQQLAAADPSNVLYPEEALYRRAMLFNLLADIAQFETAKTMMEELEWEFESAGNFADQNGVRQKEYIDFLLGCVEVEAGLGNVESANSYLNTLIELQLINSDPQTVDIFDTYRLVKMRYQSWQLNGISKFENFPAIPGFSQAIASEYRSCTEADSAARMYVLKGETDNAAREVEYLRNRGYAEPSFIRFCQQHDLCID